MTKNTVKEFSITAHQNETKKARAIAGISNEALKKISADSEPINNEIDELTKKSEAIHASRASYKSKLDQKTSQLAAEARKIEILMSEIKSLKTKISTYEEKLNKNEDGYIEKPDHIEIISNKLEHEQEALEAAELKLIAAEKALENKKQENGYYKTKTKYESVIANSQAQLDDINNKREYAYQISRGLRKNQILLAQFKTTLFTAITDKLKALNWDKKVDGTSASDANDAGILYTLAKLEDITGSGKAYSKNECLKAGWERVSQTSSNLSAPKDCRYTIAEFQKLVYDIYKEVMTNGYKPKGSAEHDSFPGFGTKVGEILKVPVNKKAVIAQEPTNSVKLKKPK